MTTFKKRTQTEHEALASSIVKGRRVVASGGCEDIVAGCTYREYVHELESLDVFVANKIRVVNFDSMLILS
jgi:hypothetical protein